MNRPAGTVTGRLTLMGATQAASVVTTGEPKNISPSPLPDASHPAFEKNSILYCMLAVLLRLPRIAVLPPPDDAEVRSGKFWPLFAPPSPSQGSFGVIPESSLRLIPSSVFEKIEFDRKAFWEPPTAAIPERPLNAIVLRAP